MKEKILKKGVKTRKRMRALSPYIISFTAAIIIYMGAPLYILLIAEGTLQSLSIIGIPFFMCIWAIILYFDFMPNYWQPGLCLLRDMRYKTLVTAEIEYRADSIECWSYFPQKQENPSHEAMKKYKKIKWKISPLLAVACRDEDGKWLYLSSMRYHGMIPGEIYTVIYGKYSKILISILAEEGKVLWNMPYEHWCTWLMKMNKVLEKREKKRGRR